MTDTPDLAAAEAADTAAIIDHRYGNATARHHILATELWATLRTLGIDSGRMLVQGQDPEIFAGLPATERRMPPGQSGDLTAPIPTAWPHTGVPVRVWTPPVGGVYDTVIANVPFNDVDLHHPNLIDTRNTAQALWAIGALALTQRGGIAVVVVSSTLMDDPDPEARGILGDIGDLVGAIRLPAAALRPAAGNDLPVDLLLLRRNWGRPTGPLDFYETVPITIDGHRVRINEYFDNNPDRILGTLTSRTSPWGPATTTVLPGPGPLASNLRAGLDDVVDTARTHRLTALTPTGRSRTPATRPADAELDAPVPYIPTDPATSTPHRYSRIVPVSTMADVRAAIDRLRQERRSPRPTNDNRDQARRRNPTSRGHDLPGNDRPGPGL